MIEELTKLYNTLALIETKGENTKLMAQCLNYITMLIEKQKKIPKAEQAKEGAE